MPETYEIYEDVKVQLRRVTPKSVKMYQAQLIAEGSKSQESIMEVVNRELPKQMQEGTITPDGIKAIVATAIQNQVAASLDIFCNRDFVDNWLNIVFDITHEQIEKTKEDFENKFCMDEFIRGHSDFFARLRYRSN